MVCLCTFVFPVFAFLLVDSSFGETTKILSINLQITHPIHVLHSHVDVIGLCRAMTSLQTLWYIYFLIIVYLKWVVLLQLSFFKFVDECFPFNLDETNIIFDAVDSAKHSCDILKYLQNQVSDSKYSRSSQLFLLQNFHDFAAIIYLYLFLAWPVKSRIKFLTVASSMFLVSKSSTKAIQNAVRFAFFQFVCSLLDRSLFRRQNICIWFEVGYHELLRGNVRLVLFVSCCLSHPLHRNAILHAVLHANKNSFVFFINTKYWCENR